MEFRAARGSINETAIPLKNSKTLPVNKYCWGGVKAGV